MSDKDIEDLLIALINQGVKFSLEKGKVRVQGDLSGLTDDTKASLQTNKARITALITQRQKQQRQPIVPLKQGQARPLSFMQQRIWFIDQLQGDASQYNLMYAFWIPERLDEHALSAALRALITRHTILRTSYQEVAGEQIYDVQQFTLESYPSPMTVEDLSALSQEQQLDIVKAHCGTLASYRFDLQHGIQIQARFFNCGDQGSALALCLHHIAVDGASIDILMHDLDVLYEHHLQGSSTALAPLPLQYADFAQWQRQWLTADAIEQDVSYWQKQLQDAPQLHSLPLEWPRTADMPVAGASVNRWQSPDKLMQLQALAKDQDVTLFMLLQTLFALTLARLGQQSDVVMGSPVTGRTMPEIQSMVGCFFNTLVLRSQIDMTQSFNQCLADNKAMILGAFAHQDVPFETLVETLQPERNLSISPLFQILFSLQGKAAAPSADNEKVLHTNRWSPIAPGEFNVKYDLTLTAVEDSDKGLALNWSYNKALFSQTRIEVFASCLETLLEQVISSPDTKLCDFILVNPEQKTQQLSWGTPPLTKQEPVFVSVADAVKEHAQVAGDQLAVEDQYASLTYNALAIQSEHLARLMCDRDIQRGDIVALYLPRSVDAVLCMLAVMQSGAAYLPLDPEWPIQRIHKVLQHARCKLIISRESVKTLTKLEANIGNGELPLLDLDNLALNDLVAGGKQQGSIYQEDALQPGPVNPDDPAYVIYTSGSTGTPKGVVISHQNLSDYLSGIPAAFGVDMARLDGSVASLSLAFDASITSFFTPLMHGSALYLTSTQEPLEDLKNRLTSDGDLLFKVTPAHLEAVLGLLHIDTQELSADSAYQTWSNRHYIAVGGDTFLPGLYQAFQRCFPNATLINHYGPTETTVGCCFKILDTSMVSYASLPIGQAFGGRSLAIVDKYGQLLPAGIPGELLIGGKGTGQGYLHEPELTESRFVSHPDVQGKAYLSGDQVYWDAQGQLQFIGRSDKQIKLRGFRIELSEIEQILLEVEGVQGTYVCIKDDKLIAYLKTSFDFTQVKERALAFIERQLPSYMQPSALVCLAAFPLTVNGKLDKQALPGVTFKQDEASYVPPQTEVQKQLCELWQQVLDVEQVGINDNFFSLGGHSLLATRLISKIRHHYTVDIPLKQIFDYPDIEGLSGWISQQSTVVSLPPMQKATDADKRHPSFAQQRLWVIQQLEDQGSQYNMIRVFSVAGKLDKQALEYALQQVIVRHHVLRTVLKTSDGRPECETRSQWSLPLFYVNGDIACSDEEQQALIDESVAQESQHEFDLSSDILIRMGVISFSDERHVMILNLHHIVSDGWSMGILNREIQQLYRACQTGTQAELPNMLWQYQDYAAWQKSWLQGDSLTRQLTFWHEYLQDAPVCHSLPLEKPRSDVQSFTGKRSIYRLEESLIANLNQIARQHNVSLFILLQSVMSLVVGRFSREKDVCMGSPISGRLDKTLDDMIGLFANTLVLRSQWDSNQMFTDFLQVNRNKVLAAFEHQHLPFELLVDAINPTRTMAHNPLFQIMLTFEKQQHTSPEIAELTFSSIVPESVKTKFDLEINLVEQAQGMACSWIHNKALFSAELIDSMMNAFTAALQQIVQQPDITISAITCVEEADIRALTQQGKGKETDFLSVPPLSVSPTKESLPQLLSASLSQHSDATAVSFGQTSMTYRELDALSNQYARILLDRGVGPDRVVAICMSRCLNLPAYLLGILKAGGAYLPIDIDLPAKRQQLMLRDSQAICLISDQAVLDESGLDRCEVLIPDNLNAAAQSHSSAPLDQTEHRADQLAYVIYTSGSTGQPKGVMIQHHALINRLAWMQQTYELTPADAVLQKTPYSFDVSVWEFFWPMLAGARLVLAEPDGHKDPEYLAELIQSESISHLHFVPSMLSVFLQTHQVGDCKSVKAIFASGEALTAEQVIEKHNHLPHAQLHNLYGPTEAAIDVSHHACASIEYSSGIPIGKPVANTELWVLDKDLRILPKGAIGELCIGGVQLAKGYINQPDLTAERFVSVSIDGEIHRLYRTGDLAHWSSTGELLYLGRTDHQVKLHGQRLELGEIEALMNQSGLVEQSAVLLAQVNSQSRLVAFCSKTSSGLKTDSWQKQLEYFLLERLPAHMVPSDFHVLEALPVTSNGKLDRRQLAEHAHRDTTANQTVQDKMLSESDGDGQRDLNNQQAQTETQRLLVGIWKKLLRTQHIGIDESFFSLGGDSILAIQATSRAREVGIQSTVRQLFQAQTIEHLARLVELEQVNQSIPQQALTGEASLLPVQRSFLNSNPANPHHFNQAAAFEVRAGLSSEQLKNMLQALHDRHDVLRVKFKATDDGWQGAYQPITPQQLNSALVLQPEPLDKNEWLTFANRMQASLSLHTGPLLRMAWCPKQSNDFGVLLVVVHHLAIDGVSWRILYQDLVCALTQIKQGQDIVLPAKTQAYQTWAEHVAELAEVPAVLDELPYWQRQCSQEQAQRFGSTGRGKIGSSVIRLDEKQTSALIAQEQGPYRMQLQEVLLSALLMAYSQVTGGDQLLLAMESHGRQSDLSDLDVSETLGWFTSVYPILLGKDDKEEVTQAQPDTSPDLDISTSLCLVKEQLRSVPNKGLGYGALNARHHDLPADAMEGAFLFNYLGDLDKVARDEVALLQFSSFPVGQNVASDNALPYPIVLNGALQQGQVGFELKYDDSCVNADWVDRLVAAFRDKLDLILSHCRQAKPHFTPSDFPLASVTPAYLDSLQQAYPEIEDLYPSTGMQQGMLFHSLLESSSSSYITTTACQLNGAVLLSQFEAAWQQVMEMHPVLRTQFVGFEQEAILQLVSDAECQIQHLDWCQYSPAEQQHKLATLNTELSQAGMSLNQAPLMDWHLVQLKDDVFHFIWRHHHALLDGWCLPSVLNQVMVCYQQNCLAQEAIRTQESDDSGQRESSNNANYLQHRRTGKTNGNYAQYRQYIEWYQRQDRASARRYWQEMLQGYTRPVYLPVESVPGVKTTLTQTLTLDRQLTASLTAHSQASRVTVSSLLQLAWAYLLHRYSSQDDIVFGTTVSGRPAELDQVESMVGLFINTVPVRVRIDETGDFDQLLQQLQQQSATHDVVSFLSLPEIHQVSELSADTPLFDSLFVFENYPELNQETVTDDQGSLPSDCEYSGQFKISDVTSQEFTHYALTLTARQAHGVLTFKLASGELADNAAKLDALLRHFKQVLKHIATADGLSALASLEFGKDKEHDHGQGPQVAYPLQWGIHEMFERQAHMTPDAVALQFEQNTLSYRDYNQQANQLARHLINLDVKPGDAIGLCVERSLHMMVAVMAILKTGAVYLPLDPANPATRLTYMLDNADADLVLTESKHQNLITASAGRILLDSPELATQVKDMSVDNPDVPAQMIENGLRRDKAYILYTSGSTGNPKGVEVSHAAAVNRIAWMQDQYKLTADDRVLQKTPLSFDVSVWELFWPSWYGAKLVIAAPQGHRDPAYLERLINQADITHIHFVPSMLAEFLQAGEGKSTQLKQVFCSGESLAAHLVETFYQKHPDAQLDNLYGPTEAAIDVSFYRCEKGQDYRHIPIGKPVANTCLHVLDSHHRAVPVWGQGELFIEGVQLAEGYVNQPELTAQAFKQVPMEAKEARLYKTGDMASYLPDGNLLYLGRRDQQSKIRGMRIELGEIECQLKLYRQIKQAFVCIKPVNGQEQLLAYLVTEADNGDESLELDALKSWLADKLPAHMLPRHYQVLSELPLTSSGKLNTRALPVPADEFLSQAEFVKPQNERQKTLCRFWQKVLQLEQVGIDDDFFALGGHSLLATRLVSLIRQQLNADIPLTGLFEHPTVRSFDSFIQRYATHTVQIKPGSRFAEEEGGYRAPMSFAQHRLWFVDSLEQGSSQYNIVLPFFMVGPLDIKAFKQAFARLIERHHILRTCYGYENEQGVQILMTDYSLPFEFEDDSDGDEFQVMMALEDMQDEERATAFDLSSEMPVRARILKLGDNRHIVSFTLHHIAVDAWSIGLMSREFSILYNGIVEGENRIPAKLPIQYADYAQWQRQGADSGLWDKHWQYWLQRLESVPKVHNLPLDLPRPQHQTFAGQTHLVTMKPDKWAKLAQLCQHFACTPFILLETAFALLVGRYSNESDIVVGTSVAGRIEAELEPLLGLFVNTLVLRTDVSGDISFEELLTRNKTHILQAYDHQALPFDLLVETLNPERSLSYNPLVQIAFNLQSAEQMPLSLNDVVSKRVAANDTLVKSDLEVQATLVEESDGTSLHLAWDYNTKLFRSKSVKRMVDSYLCLLDAICIDPTQNIHQLPIMTPKQCETLLVCEQSAVTFKPVHDMVAGIAQSYPQQSALMFEGAPEHHVTYQALHERANQLTRVLIEQGVGKESRVGVYLPVSSDLVIVLLAIHQAGAAYVPFDPKSPAQRLAFMLEDAQLALLCACQSVADTIGDSNVKQLILDAPDVMKKRQTASTRPIEQIAVQGQDLAYMIYTSGSTGQPKGVLVEHEGLSNLIEDQIRCLGIGLHNRVLHCTSMAFDAASSHLFKAICAGATVVFASPDQDLSQVMEEHSISHASLPVSLLNATPVRRLPHLNVLTVGGDKCPPALYERWADQCRFFNLYGPTEATIISTMKEVTNANEITIGKAIPNTFARVLDKHRQLAPIGATGELYLGGINLARGYWNREELTAERFIDDPFVSGQRLYRTGDLVKLDSRGDIHYVGRIDHQVKLRGYRIELDEIEYHINQLEAVHSSIVQVKENDNSQKQLIAYLVAEKGISITDSTLKRQQVAASLGRVLPDYMVPQHIVVLESWPLTTSGKLDLQALPQPQSELLDAEREYAVQLPETDNEKLLYTIWQEVLQLENMSVDDDFFALGGDSIVSLQIVAKAKQLGLAVSVRDIFEYKSIRNLAPQLQTQAISVADQTDLTGNFDLLPIQKHFFSQPMQARHHYNQSVLLIAPLDLDLASLTVLIHALVQRHDSLRMNFTPLEETGVQTDWQGHFYQADDFWLKEVVSCETLDTFTNQSIMLRCEALQQSLSFGQRPLFRVVYLKNTEGTQARLAWICHHLLVDGVSWRVLLADLKLAYEQLRQGQEIQLADKTSSVQAWRDALVAWGQTPALTQQRDYWLDKLSDLALETPFGLSSMRTFTQSHWQSDSSFVVQSTNISLSEEQTGLLLKDCQQAYRTQINELLLSALALAWKAWTQQTELRVELESHGREGLETTVDISETVGWFTTSYPVIMDLSACSQGTGALITAVKDDYRQIPNKGLGYSILLDLLDDTALQHVEAQRQDPGVLFNYLGQMDASLKQDAIFANAPEYVGRQISDKHLQKELIAINGMVLDGKLSFSLQYLAERISAEQVATFSQHFESALLEVIQHCEEQYKQIQLYEQTSSLVIGTEDVDESEGIEI